MEGRKELDVATAAAVKFASGEQKRERKILSNGPTSGKINDADDA